jgi:hypothetical protein
MKVRIEYTVDADDDFRRRINAYHGDSGKASRDDVKGWFYVHGQSMNDDLMDMDLDEEDE